MQCAYMQCAPACSVHAVCMHAPTGNPSVAGCRFPSYRVKTKSMLWTLNTYMLCRNTSMLWTRIYSKAAMHSNVGVSDVYKQRYGSICRKTDFSPLWFELVTFGTAVNDVAEEQDRDIVRNLRRWNGRIGQGIGRLHVQSSSRQQPCVVLLEVPARRV